MPELPSPHVAEFLNALDKFMENPPRDLPDGFADNAKSLGQQLRGYGDGSELSPGQKEAAAAFTNGTGEHYSKAALGPDQPSPGQREFEAAVEKVRESAFGAGT